MRKAHNHKLIEELRAELQNAVSGDVPDAMDLARIANLLGRVDALLTQHTQQPAQEVAQ